MIAPNDHTDGHSVTDRETAPRATSTRDGARRVLKFGGTSVQDAEAMRRIPEIVRLNGGDRPVVVTSACAGVTNELVACAAACRRGDEAEALRIVEAIALRHRALLQELDPTAPSDDDARIIDMLIDELRRLVRGTTLLGETTPRTVDAILSLGERLSSPLLVRALREAGLSAVCADSRTFVITDNEHGCALPLMEEIAARATPAIDALLESADVVVTQGFVAGTRDGVTTTLGRGGSDYSAALIGAALDAAEIQIWTDVDGIMTADPRIVPDARAVPEMTFSEARELAEFGAKVIHPDTMRPAIARNIPVVIRNSHRPSAAGTRLLPDETPIPAGFHSITVMTGLALIELVAPTVTGKKRRVEEAIAIFSARGVAIECAVLAESKASIMIRSERWDDGLALALKSICSVSLRDAMALICLAGTGLRSTPALLSEPLRALTAHPIALVCGGSSDHIVLFGVAESSVAEGLIALHGGLFAEPGSGE